MTAELLRRAAAQMREQAEAATPGPWTYYLGNLWRGDVAERLAAYDRTGAEDDWPYQDGEESHIFAGEPWREADAEYLAGWPPGVALAVADWLDDIVTNAAYARNAGVAYVDGWDKALAVARAYLGEEASDGDG